jgi:8-oxo-dGTP diphosphatase
MILLQEENATVENKTNTTISKEVVANRGITLSIDCVIFGFDKGVFKILVIESDYNKFEGLFSLLGDLVSPKVDLDEAALQILQKRTSLSNIFLEQVKVYGNVNRHPAGRVVTLAYCALINVNHYKLKINDHKLQWVQFDEIKEMAFDHLDIAKDCLLWLRKKIMNEPIANNLMPKKFSLRALQDLYAAILGEKLDRRNFRKKIQSLGYLVDLNEMEKEVAHRPGKLYKFDIEKQRLRE